MGEEIHLMTAIEDPAHTIKNEEVSKTTEKILRKKYSLFDTFNMVSEEVLSVVIQRCEGNPLVCLNFVFNLISVLILSHIILNYRISI